MSDRSRQILSPEQRRRSLVAAARQVFADKGYLAAGVSDIIEAAEVARGTFYNYFTSKDEVFLAVLDEVLEEIEAGIVPIDVTRDVLEQVQKNLENLVRILSSDVCRILFTEAQSTATFREGMLSAFYARVLARIVRALETGERLGLVRPGNREIRAACLLGMIKEPVFQASLTGAGVDRDLLVEELVWVLSRGIF